jgi:flagellar basal-body rod protein FlgG
VLVDGNLRGRLKLVDFQQPYPLQKTGHTLFRVSTDNAQELAAVDVSIHQGALEGSNSQPIRLLGLTLQASRAYEAYQKVIQAFDETAGRAVNDLARTN